MNQGEEVSGLSLNRHEIDPACFPFGHCRVFGPPPSVPASFPVLGILGYTAICWLLSSLFDISLVVNILDFPKEQFLVNSMLLKISLAEEPSRKIVFCSDRESFIPRVFIFPVKSKGCETLAERTSAQLP